MLFLVISSLLLTTCTSASKVTPQPRYSVANIGSDYAPVCPDGVACAQHGKAAAYHGASHPAPSGSVTVGDWQAADSVSPLYADQHVDQVIMHALWGACAVTGADLKWLPDECTEVPTQANGDVSADGLTVTMKLLPNLTWSDGQPLTASDFVFAWKLLTNPAAQSFNVGGYSEIASVTAVDAHTVRTQFKTPLGPYLSYLPYALPQHELQPIALADLITSAEVNLTPKATSGPYLVSSYTINTAMTLAPNPHYTSSSFYGPFLKQVTFSFLHDTGTLIQAFQSGSLTLAQDFFPSDLAQMGGAASLTLAVGYEHALYNQANPLLAQVAVRHALSLAVNRCTVAQAALRQVSCQKFAAASITSPQALDLDPTLAVPAPDLVTANALLDKAGYATKNSAGIRMQPNGKPLAFTLVTTNDSARQAEAAALAAMWKQIGIAITVKVVAGSQLFADFTHNGDLATGQFDIALFSFVGGADPDFTYDIYHSSAIPSATDPGGTNYGHIRDATLDAALQTERGTVDFAARVTALKQAQEIIVAKQFYVTPLYVWPLITLHAPALHDFLPGPALDGIDWNIADWWVK